jgi:hypothetical protein
VAGLAARTLTIPDPAERLAFLEAEIRRVFGLRRVEIFQEWLCSHELRKVPHRHVVFNVPMVLRRCCLYVVSISAINLLFPAPRKSYDMGSIYSV